MMPPPAYLAYQRAADHHLQVEISGRAALGSGPGPVPVTAQARRVFRSSSNLRPGDELSFRLKTFRRPDVPSPDAGGWIEYGEFQQIRYLEVFLNGRPGACEVAAFGALHYAIDGLTKRPVVPSPGRFKVALAWARFKLRGRF